MSTTVSIFTPTHDSTFLPKVYESIKDQKFDEWIILHNNGSKKRIGFNDARVRELMVPVAPEWVGPLKAHACEQATGDVLVELDHDDLLLPTAIEETVRAFEDPSVGFVFSNTVNCTGDYKPVARFPEQSGWRYRPFNYQGYDLDETVSFDATPVAVSRIWFAPNHLRAFRRKDYEKVGGYNKSMRILDDLDLMCRLYQSCQFKHIDKPLYLYRIHGQNAWLKHNREIQENVYRIYDQYIEPMALRWANASGLRAVELGGRMAASPGFETVDLLDANIIADLNDAWPFEDGSVGVVRAYDVIEHLRDPLHTMKELYRVLAPGGYAFIQVPSTDGRGAFADPTHISFWNEASFQYYTDARKAKYIGTPVRFQSVRLYTTPKDSDGVCWTRAHLLKLSNGLRVPGEVKI